MNTLSLTKKTTQPSIILAIDLGKYKSVEIQAQQAQDGSR